MTNAYRVYQLTAGCTIALLCTGTQPRPHPSIMLSTCWTIEEKCEKSTVRGKGGRVREHTPLNMSIITAISQGAHTKTEIMISISENSLEIILEIGLVSAQE